MRTIGNVIWLLFGGWLVGLAYVLGTVLFFPLAWYLSPFIGYAFWPFGRQAVRLSHIAEYKADHAEEFPKDPGEGEPNVSDYLRKVLSLAWMLTLGWMLALACVFFALMNLFLCASIILIPVAIANMGGWLKLAKVSFSPFIYRPVNSHLADAIEAHFAKKKL